MGQCLHIIHVRPRRGLDVLVARKLVAPEQEELAIGAVTANGGEFINEELISYPGVSRAYLERVKRDPMDEARRREDLFRGGRPEERIQGRVMILVDDGLATGATMRADEVPCPAIPAYFGAVGRFYENFQPTEDSEVRRILREHARLSQPPAETR